MNHQWLAALVGIASLTICQEAKAQMSPFNGSYTVVIQLPDNWKTIGGRLVLKAISPVGDSCAIYSGMVTRLFTPPDSCLIKNRNENKFWEESAREFAKDATFFTPNHLAVVLNSHEKSCVNSTNGNNIHHKRTFGVYHLKDGNETLLQIVQEEQVYSLTRYRGRWNEIQPVVLNLGQHLPKN